MWHVPRPASQQTGHLSCAFNMGTTVTLSDSSIITALVSVGVAKALLDHPSWPRSGLQMVVVGIFATLTTYLIGRLSDVSV